MFERRIDKLCPDVALIAGDNMEIEQATFSDTKVGLVLKLLTNHEHDPHVRVRRTGVLPHVGSGGPASIKTSQS